VLACVACVVVYLLLSKISREHEDYWKQPALDAVSTFYPAPSL